MIIIVGDVHGEFMWLGEALRNAPLDATIIQVGDFGCWPNRERPWRYCPTMPKFEKPVYFIDGNHEYFPLLQRTGEPREVWSGLVHIPRGNILQIDGLDIGFLGGGTSLDRADRTEGIDWFEEERIIEEDLVGFEGVESLDLLITHVPPAEVIARNFDNRTPIAFGHSPDFIDPESRVVERIWKQVGRPELVCGHMHQSVRDGSVRILDICETYVVGEVYEQNDS